MISQKPISVEIPRHHRGAEIEDKSIGVVCGHPKLYDTTLTLYLNKTKTQHHFHHFWDFHNRCKAAIFASSFRPVVSGRSTPFDLWGRKFVYGEIS